MTKQVLIEDFLTADQINQALKIYYQCKREVRPPAHKIHEEIIKPNIQTINKKLGQENSAIYLAYAVEYVFNERLKNAWKY